VAARLAPMQGPAVAVLIAAAGVLACDRHVPRTHRIAMRNFEMIPASVSVAAGDTLEWTNADFVPHTATARDSSWDSKSIDGSQAWRVVARTPGRHEYYCVFHPNMRGVVEVR
jgi:plastocyanin